MLLESDRLVGWLAILAGTAFAFGIQILAPVGVPLYDGVVVQEPYRFLRPAQGQAGSPGSFAANVDVVGARSPQVTAATIESPPQAQLIALPDAFALPAGVTSLSVSVAPVEVPTVAAGGDIAGNVYRFTVADPGGRPLPIKPCEGCISLVMRAPEDTAGEARLQRYAGGVWTDVETVHAGIVGMYATNPTALGDYAIVTRSGAGPGSSVQPGGPSVEGVPFEGYVVAGGAAVLLILLFGAVLVMQRRQGARRQPAQRTPARPIPSKRRRPNRPPPPSGRTDR